MQPILLLQSPTLYTSSNSQHLLSLTGHSRDSECHRHRGEAVQCSLGPLHPPTCRYPSELGMNSIVVLCSYLHLPCLSAANGQALLQVSKYTLHIIRLTFFVGSMLCVDSCPEVVDFARVFFRTPNRAVDVIPCSCVHDMVLSDTVFASCVGTVIIHLAENYL